MTKHTPGPWKVVETETGSQYIDAKGKHDYGVQAVLVVAEDCEAHPVADTSCNWTCRDGAECEANAHLIAAAPNLLEALEDMYALLVDMGWAAPDSRYHTVCNAAAVIKKARGE
jgi:hypothetical protein